MVNFSTITALLVFFGALVMVVNIVKFKSTLKLILEFSIEELKKIIIFFKFHQLLMIFFLFGYLAVFLSILTQINIVSNIFVGTIFFFGAIFVFLGIYLQSKLLLSIKDRYNQAIEVSKKLDSDRNKLFQMNDKLNEEIVNKTKTQKALIKAKKEAEAATKIKSDFLANMSHEIRTPMNGVMGMTNLLLDTKLSQEQSEYAEIIQSSANTLLTVINDILDFSKIEAGKLDIEELDFDLRNTVENIADVLALRAHEKDIELTPHIYYDVPALLKGDPGRIRQVFINLINNAIKFTEKGEVIVRFKLERETETHACINFIISDTGIGIPKERMNRLFQSFSQLDSSTTRKFGGTGLGLAISQKLVEMMGGKINVESEEGRGSTFMFSINFAKQLNVKEEKININVEIRDQKILIVDDNKTNRFLLTEQLKSWGCKSEVAISGAEALEKLHKASETDEPFGIVIADMMMPEMDGETLGKLIKGDTELQNTLMIMLTSVGEKGDATRMKEIGFSAYLTKPIKQSQLFDCLTTVVGTTENIVNQSKETIITKHSLVDNNKSKISILLAEDNITNQKVALRILHNLGYQADIVDNGQKAVQCLREKQYDLVLMDIQMPEMDGFEATNVIRESNDVYDSNIPIIALTAHAMKGDRERCLEQGMDDYLAKPIDPQELLEKINKFDATQVKKIAKGVKNSVSAS